MILKKKPLVVWVSDMHIGRKMSICPPEVAIGNDMTAIIGKAQRALWDAWVEDWQNIKARRRDVVLVLGGEVGDLDLKERTWELWSRDENNIILAAAEVLDTPLKIAHDVIVLRGTEAHSGKNACLDELIAQDMTGVHVVNGGDSRSHWYVRQNIAGVTFDLAHHVSMGSRPWTERNAANALAAQLQSDYAGWQEQPPDFALRGHVHRFSDSGTNFRTRVLISGCWTLHDAYIHRIGGSPKMPEIGMWIVDTENRNVERVKHELNREPPQRIY
jgi:hypothetical protein